MANILASQLVEMRLKGEALITGRQIALRKLERADAVRRRADSWRVSLLAKNSKASSGAPTSRCGSRGIWHISGVSFSLKGPFAPQAAVPQPLVFALPNEITP